ncbi:hypothetical protein KVF89_28320 [Nocardioides carbamazepini]|nr:hypothetical protein [Nocardioides carbamazepini]
MHDRGDRARPDESDRVAGRIDGMSAEPSFEKASWTIPSDVLEAVRRHAPRGKVSAYVADALRRQLELDDLAVLVDEMEAVSGPFDPEVVARYAEEMR